MAKSNGLGDNAYVGGVDLSGDILSLDSIHGGPAPGDVTPINASAFVRIGMQRDGSFEFTSAMDPATSHPALAALPTADVMCGYFHQPALGNPAASCIARQVDYPPARDTAGMITIKVAAQADGYGMEWGTQATPGLRTDTTATAASSSNSVDDGAQSVFGAQAYLQVTAFTGTDVTIKVRDSADNSSFADVTGLAFTTVTAAPFTQRLATANNATLRRYVAVATSTSGGFTSVTFAVMYHRNELAGQVF